MILYSYPILFIFTLVFVLLQNFICLASQHDPYHHIANLDGREGRYVLEWAVNWTNRSVTFNVTVATIGYIGFGLSSRGSKEGSDLVIGGVDLKNGPYLIDMHGSLADGKPVKDKLQNYVLDNAWENATHTSLLFSRHFQTCDKFNQDYTINNDTVVLLWSIGKDDNYYNNPPKTEGTYRIHLLDPDWTPRKFQDIRRAERVPTLEELGDLKVWTVSRHQLVPPTHTVYWCSFHKGPVLQKRHHLVGFNFRREEEIVFNRTHHMSLLRCQAPDGQDPVKFFEPFVQNNTGEMCYFFLRGAAEGLPLQYCRETVYAYAIGERMFFLPEHAGIPFGDNPHEYYLLQVHYDNNDFRTDLEYTINIDLYYTENLRENEAALTTTGHHIPGSPAILVPQGSKEHAIYGHCGSGCTSVMLPPEGINIISVVQHTHLYGRRHRIQHFRNGKELPWIVNDENYDGNFQAMRMQMRETKVLPGDHLVTRCVYDNTWTNATMVGGFTTMQEMCLEYIWYYNKMKEHVLCRSEIAQLEEYTEKHLGVRNYTWSDANLEYVVTDPEHLAGLTLSQVADKEGKWSTEKRKELQRDQRRLSHRVSCPSFSQLMNGNNGEEGGEIVEYPGDHVKMYIPDNVDKCSEHEAKWLN